MITLHLNQVTLLIVKVHITPLTKFRPENPCGVKRSYTKNFLQLSFSSFEKIQNYDVTSGNHYQAFYGGNYDKLK